MPSSSRKSQQTGVGRDPGTMQFQLQSPVVQITRVVTVALASKTARVIWAIMTRGGIYGAPALAGSGISWGHWLDRQMQTNREQIQRCKDDAM